MLLFLFYRRGIWSAPGSKLASGDLNEGSWQSPKLHSFDFISRDLLNPTFSWSYVDETDGPLSMLSMILMLSGFPHSYLHMLQNINWISIIPKKKKLHETVNMSLPQPPPHFHFLLLPLLLDTVFPTIGSRSPEPPKNLSSGRKPVAQGPQV